MAISAVTGNLAQNVSFSGKKHSRENVDRFIEMDDMQLALLARDKTIQDYKKKRQSARNLLLATPVIAGISTAILSKGNTRFLTQTVEGRSAKLVSGLKGAAPWALALASFGVVNGAVKFLDKKFDKFAQFRSEHGTTSFIADLAAMGLVSSAIHPFATGKIAGMLKKETVQNIAKKVKTSADFINGIKLPKALATAKDTVAKYIPEAIKPSQLMNKAPNLLKASGKSVISFAPYVALATALFKSVSAGINAGRDFNQNFVYLKQKQESLAEKRNSERTNPDSDDIES